MGTADVQKSKLHGSGSLCLAGLEFRLPFIHAGLHKLPEIGVRHRMDVVDQPGRTVLQGIDVRAGKHVDERSGFFAGSITDPERGDEAGNQPTGLHQRQAGIDEAAADEDFSRAGTVLRVHAVRATDVIRMHDKVIEHDKPVQAKHIGIASRQDDDQPPRLKQAIPWCWSMIPRTAC
jgi:hypothetical protein